MEKRFRARYDVLARYTRYAHDLAFSGGESFARCNHRKTRVMRQGLRQHLAGLVTNRKVNVMRADFDRLKATLTNCARHGPEGQNRTARPHFRAHLEGRIAFVESINAPRGRRLRAIFETVDWK